MKLRRIGLLGGTFDPIHLGHIALARVAKDQLDLERVILIPAATPPHKNPQQVSPSEIRLAMTLAAIEDQPGFEVSDIEITRPGLSYTVDTLMELKNGFGDGVELHLIVGRDNVGEMHRWYMPEQIFALARVAVGWRAGFEASGREDLVSQMRFLHGPELDVSATELRQTLIDGDDPFTLPLPKSVAEIIERNGIYRDTSDGG